MTDQARIDGKAARLITIEQAAKRGIERLRIPKWANPLDHLKIDIIDGKPGPWLHLYAPFNKECNGRDPVDILIGFGIGEKFDTKMPIWVPYKGPLPDSQEYRDAVQGFAGSLTGRAREEQAAQPKP